MSPRPLPSNPARILLVNPTRYLGNLLIAGGLIQQFARYCHERNIEFKVVLDSAFAELLHGALPAESLLLYPRRRIKQTRGVGKLLEYWRFLREIRRFRADIAFNIEEDSVSHRLTQWSGARYRLGCSKHRHGLGYERVEPVEFVARAAGEQHRWHSCQEMFALLGLPPSQPGYLQLPWRRPDDALTKRLHGAGIDFGKQQVVLHTGATKDYKKWPLHYFAALCEALRDQQRQIVFIGAGADAAQIDGVLKQVAQPHTGIINLCNQLSLAELSQYLRRVRAMVGNDSGPFHLAAAVGVAGLVIFGPTNVALWGPLSPRTQVLQSAEGCASGCTRGHCVAQYRCLNSITPAQVLARLQPLLET